MNRIRTLLATAALLSVSGGLSLAPAWAEQAETSRSAKQGELPPLLDPETDVPGLPVGAAAPDAAVKNRAGETIRLSELYADGPVVLVFYRGGWCPYCNAQLSSWAPKVEELESLGYRFVAVSPETREHQYETIAKTELKGLALSDAHGETMRRFRVGFELTPETVKKYRGFGINLDSWNTFQRWELPAPATFVIDEEGVIRWSHASWGIKNEDRAAPEKVLKAIRNLN